MTTEEQDKADRIETAERLTPMAQDAADVICRWINANVPASIPTMRYSRQWVLEEAIKTLKGRV